MPWSFFRGCPEFLGPLCGSPGCLGAFLGVSWPLGSLAGSTPAAWVPSGEHPGCLGPLCGSPGRPGLWVTAPPPRAVHLQHRGHQRFRGLREGGDRHPSQDAQAYPLREWHWEHWERIGRERGVLGGNWQALGWTGGRLGGDWGTPRGTGGKLGGTGKYWGLVGGHQGPLGDTGGNGRGLGGKWGGLEGTWGLWKVIGVHWKGFGDTGRGLGYTGRDLGALGGTGG